MSRTELVKRYILFIIGLFFAGLGVALTKTAGLGVSPISSVANVFSCRFTVLSLGTWLILWNCTMILGQIVLLRRDFQLIQLLQIPLSFLFGWFTDLGMWLFSFLPVKSYPVQLVLALAGIAVLGFGISLAFVANVILNSGEAFVKALADTFHWEFGNVKVGFDVSCVLMALLLSLTFFHFSIVGIREGTVLSALLTGLAVKFYNARLLEPLNGILQG